MTSTLLIQRRGKPSLWVALSWVTLSSVEPGGTMWMAVEPHVAALLRDPDLRKARARIQVDATTRSEFRFVGFEEVGPNTFRAYPRLRPVEFKYVPIEYVDAPEFDDDALQRDIEFFTDRMLNAFNIPRAKAV